MLSLSRKVGSIVEIGDDIKIHIISFSGKQWVKIGIEAPDNVIISRPEAKCKDIKLRKHKSQN